MASASGTPTSIDASQGPLRIDVLTLAAHRRQVWVRLLVERMLAAVPGAEVRVLDVEDAVVDLSPQAALRKPHVLVNRVSDAAAPPLAKATLTLLAAAERTGVRVINGAKAYGTGMSKVLHHVALEGAGLATPRSLMVRALPPPGGLGGLRFPLLLKPNSGGFGAGIVRLESQQELEEAVSAGSIGVGADGMALLQEYVAPAGGETFRVWVADGAVQCAVRIWHRDPGDFGACMSTACQVHQVQRSVHAWAVPPDIAASVVSVMAACGADCGSVEFLYPEHAALRDAAAAEPLFYDVNMLSTLPLPGGLLDQAGIWDAGMDPWMDLAAFIIREAESCRQQRTGSQ